MNCSFFLLRHRIARVSGNPVPGMGRWQQRESLRIGRRGEGGCFVNWIVKNILVRATLQSHTLPPVPFLSARTTHFRIAVAVKTIVLPIKQPQYYILYY